MSSSLYKLSDLASRWVSKMVWVQEGYEYTPPEPPDHNIPIIPIEPIDDDPGDPFHYCSPGYHPRSVAVLEGPYLIGPEYQLHYYIVCELN